MDFGAFDGLVSSQNNNNNNKISGYDLDPKPKWYGSGGGFCKQERHVSVSHEDEWRDLKMAKISQDDFSKAMLLQQQRSYGTSVYSEPQNMLSFSSPNTQTAVTLPYYARNTAGYGTGGPFTPSQWMELEHQALIYKYITANAAIPSNLLIPIRKALETAYPGPHLRQNTFGWGAFHLGLSNNSDPEPGRCRRTDGKKWRCARDAVADQKYCERHMNRGRHRSRKPVEGQTGHSVPNIPAAATTTTTAVSAVAVTTSSTILSHLHQLNSCSMQPGTPKSSQDNRSVLNKANLGCVPLARSEFGLVSSDSLLNPLHENDKGGPKTHNSLRQFMDDWPHSDRTQLSISTPMGPASSSDFMSSSTSSPTSERLNLSPLRMGLGMSNTTFANVFNESKQTNWIPISWENSMGGPLGEVLQHSTHNSVGALNLMTEG